jgi:hypothetical protein
MDQTKLAETALGVAFTVIAGGLVRIWHRVAKVELKQAEQEAHRAAADALAALNGQQMTKLGDKMHELSNALAAHGATIKMVAEMQAEERQAAQHRHQRRDDS